MPGSGASATVSPGKLDSRVAGSTSAAQSAANGVLTRAGAVGVGDAVVAEPLVSGADEGGVVGEVAPVAVQADREARASPTRAAARSPLRARRWFDVMLPS
ncbi:hypothetical protein FFA01_00490 [Frigoribacterium faeni]|uniref:Uncharacterized protein n=1 Tax=Frigoribacterium faeni TaxID=145483 RepID=A0ABQ0UJR4_9MICO|nr:hypothetical protein GCM10025699_49390 [Microbacterium flavescens]GEK81740.1 hypothetical protein FFA01_00490 [Frigoribacterium faeni]